MNPSPSMSFAAQWRAWQARASGPLAKNLRLNRDYPWLEFAMPATFAPAGEPDAPGLWRWVGAGSDRKRVFELHCAWLAVAADADAPAAPAEHPFVACLDWLHATALGQLPSAWAAPARETVAEWIEPGKLALAVGPILRQGECRCQPDRLRLRFPMLPHLPPDLPERRRRWLEEVVAEAQTHCRLVRLRFDETLDTPALVAECDLSGAPRRLLKPMLSTCLDCLRHCVGGLVETAELLANAQAASRALELCPMTET